MRLLLKCLEAEFFGSGSHNIPLTYGWFILRVIKSFSNNTQITNKSYREEFKVEIKNQLESKVFTGKYRHGDIEVYSQKLGVLVNHLGK